MVGSWLSARTSSTGCRCFGWELRTHVVIDEHFFRPAEVDLLVGDAAKAETQLGWRPRTRFNQLVEMMVDHDLETLQRQGAG